MNSLPFGCIRSTNIRLHSVLEQEEDYSRYLRRIENIVDKKPCSKTSTEWKTLVNEKTIRNAKAHHSHERCRMIDEQNQHLLNRIINIKTRRNHNSTNHISVPLEERRRREYKRILEDNLKLAKRITEQSSLLKRLGLTNNSSENRISEHSRLNDSLILRESLYKERKLPKLIVRNENMSDARSSSRVLEN